MGNRGVISRREFVGATGKAVVAMSCGMFCRSASAQNSGRKNGKLSFKLVAPCGMYCGACETLINGMYAKDPKEVTCLGCLSDTVPEWSRDKCMIRPCAMGKKVESCALCESYPCEKLTEFLKRSRNGDAGFNLKRIAGKGLDKFKKEQKAKWSCRKCSAAFSTKDKACRRCGAPTSPAK